MLLLLPYTEYLRRAAEPRNIADIVLVFLLVYAVLKLLRGTRAAPMAAGIGVLVFFYWLSRKQDLATLEFVLSNGLFYIGIAIIVLFQSEIRQALITFGNRFRMPFSRVHRGQFGEGVYDEVILAATTLASTKTGALIVIERNVGLKNITDGGVKLDAELSYDLLVSIFNTASPLHDGAVVVRRHRIAAASCFLPLTLNPRLSRDLGTRHRAADRKSTRLNSSHMSISYAVFCLKKKKNPAGRPPLASTPLMRWPCGLRVLPSPAATPAFLSRGAPNLPPRARKGEQFARRIYSCF